MAKGGGGINIVLSADAEALKKGLAEAKAALSKTADSAIADQQRMAKAADKFTKEAANAGTLRAQNRALFNLAASYESMGEAGSKAFRETLKQAGAAKDRMGDLQMMVEAGHMEGKMKVFAGALQNVIGMIAGVQGAMHLMGVNADKAAEITARLQSLMAMSQGISSFIALRDQVKALAATTSIAATAQKALNMTMAISPLGIAAIAVGALVVAFGNFKSEVKKVTNEQKAANNVRIETNKLLQDEYGKSTALIGVAKNEKLSRETRNAALNKLNELYPDVIKNMSVENTSASALQGTLDNLTGSIIKQARAKAAMNELIKLSGQQMTAEQELLKQKEAQEKKAYELAAKGASPDQVTKGTAALVLAAEMKKTEIKNLDDQIKFLQKQVNATAVTGETAGGGEDKGKQIIEQKLQANKDLMDIELLRIKATGANEFQLAAAQEQLMIKDLQLAKSIGADKDAIRQREVDLEKFKLQRIIDETAWAQDQIKAIAEEGPAMGPKSAALAERLGAMNEGQWTNLMRTNRKFFEQMKSQDVSNFKEYIRSFYAEYEAAAKSFDPKGFTDAMVPPDMPQKIDARLQTANQLILSRSRHTQRQTDAQINALNQGLQQGLAQGTDAFEQFAMELTRGDENAGKNFGNSILMAVAGFMKTLGSAMIAAAVASDTFQKALLTQPVLAIVAGAALVAASGIVKGLMKTNIGGDSGGSGGGSGGPQGIRRFASGGIISGPTIGMMGEYPGAKSNPEVVAPLDKLKNIIGTSGGGGGELVTRISGQDLLIMLDRAETYRGRVR